MLTSIMKNPAWVESPPVAVTVRRTVASLARSSLLLALTLSVLISLGLFWLMYSFIGADHRSEQMIEALPAIDFVRLRRDTQVESLERRKPPPPPPQQPPPMQRMQIASEATPQNNLAPSPMAIPNLGLSTNVGGGPFIGEMGQGAAPGMGGLFDGDIIPLQRIAPQYPRDAARAGITGWVRLEVLVNADGTVRSAKVIEAQPKGLFDASAVAAVLRWQFKPKVVDGTPVAQRGLQRIEFNMNRG
jgi:protein TonB